MSHFSMFVPTKANVKLAYGNPVHAQGIGIVLCHFPNLPIIYSVDTDYYCTGHPSNNMSLGALKFNVGFKKVTYEPLEIIKLLLKIFRNQDKRVSFIRVDEDGELERYSESMRACHNMNITVKNRWRCILPQYEE